MAKRIERQATSQVPSMATEEALEKLQNRFRRTMLEVADLTEEKQRLEHVVMQLQFETETIGEYITLYQNQRRLLKRKEHERDVEMRKLTEERELMSGKLLYLNKLIEEFVDKQQVGSGQENLKNNKNSENLSRQETAGKILEVLSEIKKSNSTPCDHNNSIGVENVSCCYGKIETV
jgi:golgin subfamily A member 2